MVSPVHQETVLMSDFPPCADAADSALSGTYPIGSEAPAAWRFAADLLGSSDRQILYNRLTRAIGTLAGSAAVALLLLDAEQQQFLPAVPPVDTGLDALWSHGPGLAGMREVAQQAARAGQAVVLDDPAVLQALALPPSADTRAPGSLCAIPILAESVAVGVVIALDATPRARPYPLETLGAFAHLAGLALSTVQAQEREKSLRVRLEALDEASKAVAAALAPEQVLQRIIAIATALVGARYGALGVAGADGYLTEFITTGIAPEERQRMGSLPRGHGLLGVLIRQGQPLRVADINQDSRRVGFPPHHPPMTSLLGVPIRVHDQVVGDLYLTDKIGAPSFTDEDQRLAELLAAHAGIAIENARLYEEVGNLAGLRERERIARDLHDGIIQDIYAATLQLENLAEDLPDSILHDRALAVADGLVSVIADVRTYIQGLRVRMLEGRLLADGIAALARDVERRGGPSATFALDGNPYRVPDATANTLLHIAREALSNVMRHARASQVSVQLCYLAEGVRLSVRDNGRGFDTEDVWGEDHHGLRNLRARAVEAGGTLDVESGQHAGTRICAYIPEQE